MIIDVFWCVVIDITPMYFICRFEIPDSFPLPPSLSYLRCFIQFHTPYLVHRHNSAPTPNKLGPFLIIDWFTIESLLLYFIDPLPPRKRTIEERLWACLFREFIVKILRIDLSINRRPFCCYSFHSFHFCMYEMEFRPTRIWARPPLFCFISWSIHFKFYLFIRPSLNKEMPLQRNRGERSG